MNPPLFGVIGWKNSGKTTLVAGLVAELSARGYRVSAVKHAHESFDIDHPGRDSFVIREAGASQVAIVSPARIAVMQELKGEPEPAFHEVLGRLEPCDVVVVEGFKRERFPKIEARLGLSPERPAIAPRDPTVIAIASAEPSGCEETLPCFDLADFRGIADFIVGHLELGQPCRTS